MILLLLLGLLVVPYLMVRALERFNMLKVTDSSRRFRVGASALFAFTGVGHFLKTEEMAGMMGSSFPGAIPAVIVTGAVELLAAAGLWVPKIRRKVGWALIAMLVCFLPVNIYAAIQQVPFGGHGAGPAYLLLRVPFQFLLMWWVWKGMGGSRVKLDEQADAEHPPV